MATKVGEFFLEMLVDAASGNLSVRQLVSALGELDVASATSVGIVGKIAEGLWGLAKAATGTAVEMSELAAITGIDPKIAQQWDKAAERVTHHAGVMSKAIMSFHEIQKNVANGLGAPAALSGTLGINPYKTSATGDTTTKDGIEIIKELAAAGSTYRTLSRDVRQKGLGDVFGAGSNDLYELIEEMIKGNVHPGSIQVLSDKQVGDLNKVDSDWIAVKQDVVGIFDKFILAGHDVDRILVGARALLADVNKWLDRHKDHSYVNDAKNIREAWKPGTALDMLNMVTGLSAAQYRLALPHIRPPSAPTGTGDLRGKLDISLISNGKQLGTKTAYIDRAGTMRDFWSVTDTQGNTP